MPPDPLPEAAGPRGHPTTACAKCESTSVYMTEDGSVVCGKCGALLVIELTEVTPG
jgi:transcription initiation factor TFIIIB Brf1 subunit/transcription initiation factor TFIIB